MTPPRALAGLVAAALCAGCASAGPARAPVDVAAPPRVEARSPGASFHLDLVERLAREGQCRAAIAHLDALAAPQAISPEARLLRADCQRRLGETGAARALYESLLDGGSGAQARRGLALLAASDGGYEVAAAQLESARHLAPTDPQILNDLGYALLRLGRYGQAREALETGMELGGPTSRAARNLLLLLWIVGDEAAAATLQSAAALDAQAAAAIRAQAHAWRVEPAVPAAPDEHREQESER